MSDRQFKQYENLHIFASEWCNYERKSDILEQSDFRAKMQTKQYVDLLYINRKTGRDVYIYLFEEYSKYTSSSDLKRLLSSIGNPSDVILVTAEAFKNYSIKAINSIKHLRIKTYLHENFDIVVPKGPLCYKHRIMSVEEVNQLVNNELFTLITSFPKILLEDVQCIWIGAEIGDVIEITPISHITGKNIQYRVVAPKSGRIISFRDSEKPVEAEFDEKTLEDEDVAEHRENANIDNELSDNDDATDE
jgi:DNA-directed RNA polymerase subunit H (RpoH/RPB5)